MHLVFVNPVGEIGGAERVLLDAAASLRSHSPSLQLTLVAGADGPLVAAARSIGMAAVVCAIPPVLAGAGDSSLIGGGRLARLKAFARMPRLAAAAYSYSRRLKSQLRELNPTIIHSNGIKSHLFTRIALGRSAPLVWHIHDFLSHRPLMRMVLPRLASGVRGMVAISKAVADDARLLFPHHPIVAVLNAVDTDRFSPIGPLLDLDSLAGLPAAASETVRIGLIATYAKWKGQDAFLDAAAIVNRQLAGQARFFVIGGPIYRTAGSQFSREELEHRIEALGLRNCVGLIGFQNDTPSIYRSLDVVVHASTRPEPFGLTIAEAMSCGRATVVSAAGGAVELFTDGTDALGVPPGHIDALAEAISRLTSDPAVRQRLGVSARQTALRRFDRLRYGGELLAAYRTFLPENH